MITTQRLLKIPLLLKGGKSKKERNDQLLWTDIEKTVILHKSWVSLYVLAKIFHDETGRDPVFCVPEYYCDDTLVHLRSVAEVCYYKINDDLSINYKACFELLKSERYIDFFVGVHYFGKEYDFNSIKNLCKNQEIFFVEDAVHVAVPYGKIGKHGDFCIYSPWKTYGLYDGAILCVNCKEAFGLDNRTIIVRLQKYIDSLPKVNDTTVGAWRAKKIIQRFIPYFFKSNRYISNMKEERYKNSKPSVSFDIPKQVSDFSKRIVCNIKEEMLLLLDRKFELSACIEDFVAKKYGVNHYLSDNEMPYSIVLETSDYSTKVKIAEDINRIGKIVYEWPSLPNDLPKDTNAYRIKNKLIMIAVHDGISFRKVSRALGLKGLYNVESMDTYAIEPISEEKYEKLTNVYMTPILQSRVYVNGKRDLQGWKRTMRKITKNGVDIAFFALLTKYGVVHRINHGPVYMDGVTTEDKIRAIQLIKSKYSGMNGILLFAPNIERTGYSMNSLLTMGFDFRNSFFRTGFVDLTKAEDILRKNLSSKWRNCLKNAEKRGIEVQEMENRSDFNMLLYLHSLDKKSRGYQDSGDEITRYLYDNSSLIGQYTKNEEDTVTSFVLFALHGCSATYLIGWSNEEGYRTNASRLLLWSGILKLKSMGYKYLDLGGIDYIHTKGVAEFKEGIGCELFEYVGEFYSL